MPCYQTITVILAHRDDQSMKYTWLYLLSCCYLPQAMLQRFQRHAHICQLVLQAENPPCIVLEEAECDTLKASGETSLRRLDIKPIVKSILEAH